MPRVKRGLAVRKRHKKLRKATKGYVAGRSREIRRAHEARLAALKHAQKHRRMKKRDFRSLWIARINSGLRNISEVTYSTFIHQMQLKDVQLDRKTLAYLADQAPEAFKAVVKFVMKTK
jgi:large subunit ribosomal protein L20